MNRASGRSGVPSVRSVRAHAPAEWHEHEAVWLAWPGNADEWRGDLEPARRGVAALAAAIAGPSPQGADPGHPAHPAAERIEMLVHDQAGEASARALLGDVAVRFHHLPYGDIWLRDTGPVFLVDDCDGALSAARFAWNGWGGKYLIPHDDEVAARIAALAGCPAAYHDLVLEGGAIDSDGQGTLLSTRQCLLGKNRNPTLDPATLEHMVCKALGAERLLWLDRGLANDHTDGHIDNLARFVAPGVVMCMRPSDPGDPNRAVLEDIARVLAGSRDAAGRRLEVIEIASPGLVRDPDGEIAPASYMNFYIGNRAVVVPVYGAAQDDAAITALAALFPGRQVIGLDARAILWGGGAFHCITRDQPARAARPASFPPASPSAPGKETT